MTKRRDALYIFEGGRWIRVRKLLGWHRNAGGVVVVAVEPEYASRLRRDYEGSPTRRIRIENEGFSHEYSGTANDPTSVIVGDKEYAIWVLHEKNGHWLSDFDTRWTEMVRSVTVGAASD